jgi:uncharacterized membrane protein YdbT with pleckstrin-like domain
MEEDLQDLMLRNMVLDVILVRGEVHSLVGWVVNITKAVWLKDGIAVKGELAIPHNRIRTLDRTRDLVHSNYSVTHATLKAAADT